PRRRSRRWIEAWIGRRSWLFTERGDDGREVLLGEARQAREAARGAFDGAWGALAISAAGAAADAMIELTGRPPRR
ncbi:MAG: hypothetical protein AAGM38_09145, partial [Pseudomonadota bacterium]